MTGGPPQQAPPVSVPSSMPGPPGGAMGAPMRGPPPPRPPMGSMPPGGMYEINRLPLVKIREKSENSGFQ